jgi:hypothetical protein
MFASAGSQQGIPTLVHTSYSSHATHPGYLFLFLNGTAKTGNPACSTAGGGARWVINNSWPAAKSQLSILLTAIATGKQVLITGSNACEVWGDSETVIDIRLMD